MTRTLAKTLVALALTGGASFGLAQNDPPPPNGWSYCRSFTTPNPSIPYITNSRADDLFRVTDGAVGTVTYWGINPAPPGAPQAAPECAFHAETTYNVAGRIGFASGPVGSIQSSFDDDMDYTLGMPNDPVGNWSYATTVRKDPTTNALTYSMFGTTISNKFFEGASGRYMIVENISDNIDTFVRIDVIGDAGRILWQMTNLATTAQDLGLWYGAQMAILPVSEGDGNDVLDTSGFPGFNPVFITFPGHKPLLVDGRYTRA